MHRVVISGLGFITSIGNSIPEVTHNLKTGTHGIETFAPFAKEEIPCKVIGSIKGFDFPTAEYEDWVTPPEYKIRRDIMKPMPPSSVYAHCAMQQLIQNEKLTPEQISNERTGLLSASGGSMWMTYNSYDLIFRTGGVHKLPPMAVINSIPGSLYINMAASFKIKGASYGLSSACASSGHAFGNAFDLIRLGRQDRMFVVGAEDCNEYIFLPFNAVRALSVREDKSVTPSPFDKNRDGFVGTGGATAMMLESLESAQARGAHIYAEVLGWGQSSDGFNVLAPEPTGEGLARSMTLALEDAKTKPEEVDYLNAHATATPPGDAAEIAAIKKVFPENHRPHVSSTKALTGHGLSLAAVMELGFTCLAMKENFIPLSAKIKDLDPMCEGVPVATETVSKTPRTIIKNSSGFGGANVSIVAKKWDN